MLEIEEFKAEFDQLTADWDWEIDGFIDKKGYVYPIDTDTKVISTVFERLASPVIRSISKSRGYIVETANQTTYPDFTLTHYGTGDRIAIDIKTTYTRRKMGLTLGGYNSFLRTENRNILYPYSTYRDHWIIGFVYNQRPVFEEYDLDKMPGAGDIPCPYEVKSVFVRRKHEISGLRAGSGNTKNIGSIIVDQSDAFGTQAGPFMSFERAREACDHYWKRYEVYIATIRTAADLTAHPDFQRFGPIAPR